MTLVSMTGFADHDGSAAGFSWIWEARSVNGRGLDLRLRLPEGLESLDAPIRAAAGRVLSRGSVTVVLRLARGGSAALPRLNPAMLDAAIAAVLAAAESAKASGLDLASMTAADLISVRGVVDTEAAGPGERPEIVEMIAAGVEPLFAALDDARRTEGAALATLIESQIDRIAALTLAARETAEARAGRSGELLRRRMEAVLAGTAAVDEARLAQELAIIAVRADVTEELDRLDAHVAAARTLFAGDGPVGRKFDFLMQEFNREANTLCAKSGAADLTAVGLELKVVVDQMREQVQNVE